MRIDVILRECGLSLKELSKQTSIGYYTLQKYGTGKRNISVKNAKKLGKFLKFDWWLLFEEDEKGVGK